MTRIGHGFHGFFPIKKESVKIRVQSASSVFHLKAQQHQFQPPSKFRWDYAFRSIQLQRIAETEPKILIQGVEQAIAVKCSDCAQHILAAGVFVLNFVVEKEPHLIRVPHEKIGGKGALIVL